MLRTQHCVRTGSVQTFTAPVDGWYEVTLLGAKGGNDGGGTRGFGGKTIAEISLSALQNIYVYVGYAGQDQAHGYGAGWNGGGNPGGGHGSSGSGGGASDIRTMSGNWNQNLGSRGYVAGGGGGAGNYDHWNGHGGSNGGVGGGLTGGTSQHGVSGGTQTNPGPGGTFGCGGINRSDGGGGGGGWYGGGADQSGDDTYGDKGGGGGSSYYGGTEGMANRSASTYAGVNNGPCRVTFILKERVKN